MPFTKGDPNINRNGRPKGSRNHVTKMIEEQFGNVLENKLDKVELWLQQTASENPAKALELLMKLSERFLPALQRTELTAKDGEELFKNITFKFGGEPTEDEQSNATEE